MQKKLPFLSNTNYPVNCPVLLLSETNPYISYVIALPSINNKISWWWWVNSFLQRINYYFLLQLLFFFAWPKSLQSAFRGTLYAIISLKLKRFTMKENKYYKNRAIKTDLFNPSQIIRNKKYLFMWWYYTKTQNGSFMAVFSNIPRKLNYTFCSVCRVCLHHCTNNKAY